MAENGVSGFFVILKVSKANNSVSDLLVTRFVSSNVGGANEADMHRMNFELEPKTARNAGSAPGSISPMLAVVFITWMMGLAVFRTWF
jgi:hypothetical protein